MCRRTFTKQDGTAQEGFSGGKRRKGSFGELFREEEVADERYPCMHSTCSKNVNTAYKFRNRLLNFLKSIVSSGIFSFFLDYM